MGVGICGRYEATTRRKGAPGAFLREAGSLFLLIYRDSFVFLTFPMIVPCLSWLSPLLATLFISVSSCFVDSCSVFFIAPTPIFFLFPVVYLFTSSSSSPATESY